MNGHPVGNNSKHVSLVRVSAYTSVARKNPKIEGGREREREEDRVIVESECEG